MDNNQRIYNDVFEHLIKSDGKESIGNLRDFEYRLGKPGFKIVYHYGFIISQSVKMTTVELP